MQHLLWKNSISFDHSQQWHWGNLKGSTASLAMMELAESSGHLIVVIANDIKSAYQLESELQFFNNTGLPLLFYPDWETLPFDSFSPHEDIISQRLSILYRLPHLKKGIVIIAVQTLLHRTLPKLHLLKSGLLVSRQEKLSLKDFQAHLEQTGYRRTEQVMEHG